MDKIKNTRTGIIYDFDLARDKICYRLINRRMNKGFLHTVPHRRFHDLAICYYLQCEGMKTESIISDSLTKSWNIDEPALYELAHKNTKLLNRGRIATVFDLISTTEEFEAVMNDGFDISCSKTDFLPMYVATNAENRYGASVILYDGLLDSIAEQIGNFYALPSSIHEFICLPDTSGCIDYFTEIVRDINTKKNSRKEVLSENIYYYNSEKHEFKMAE